MTLIIIVIFIIFMELFHSVNLQESLKITRNEKREFMALFGAFVLATDIHFTSSTSLHGCFGEVEVVCGGGSCKGWRYFFFKFKFFNFDF